MDGRGVALPHWTSRRASGGRSVVELLADDQVADGGRGLWFILGAVSLVLLIACANVAGLLLVRGESRRAEVAVRSALGASRARLACQVLVESVILTTVGAAAGLALARAGIVFVRAMPADTVPRIDTVTLDANVLLFTLALSALVAVLFGLGLYGVAAYIVAQRGPEISIRMALGAQREQVVRIVLAQGLRSGIVAVVLVLGLELPFGRVVESLLFEVSSRDPLIFSAVVGVLANRRVRSIGAPGASCVDRAVTLREP